MYSRLLPSTFSSTVKNLLDTPIKVNEVALTILRHSQDVYLAYIQTYIHKLKVFVRT